MKAVDALVQQRRLLQMEYEEEKKTFGMFAEKSGVSRLVERGYAWWPLRVGRTYYNSLNQRVVEVYRTSDEEIDHGFEYGKPVAFFTSTDDTSRRKGRGYYVSPNSGQNQTKILFTGTVSYVEDERMVVAIPENVSLADIIAGEGVGVMLSFDETSYRTMFDALDYAMNAKGRLGELRDLLYSRRKVGELSFFPLRFPYLNRRQEEGVNKVLYAKDVAIVHGPPGTGKTTTLVEAIHETLRRESQVLVCAQSNMAVDWISEKLVDRGVNVLRLGNPSRVNDKMLSFTYERRFEAHPDYPTLWSIRKAIRELHGERRRSTEQWHQKMDRLKSRATELEIRINNDIFGSAHVIASTLVGSASRLLDGMKFSTLFIDEAAQALEAASWIAMRRAGRVILAGDHCQLPPVVKCYEAMKGGLAKTLMERVVENHPEAVVLLTTQYRMNEEIMQFSSQWFYGGEIEASPEVRYRGILDYDTPMEWLDTSQTGDSSGVAGEEAFGLSAEDSPEAFRESMAGESHGKVNKDEALFTLLTLQQYIERIGKQRVLDERIDVGVISPYRAQVHYLRRLLARTPFFRPFRKQISVNTVDGFQGQERDVIVISLVRSNDEGNIGFLRDLRRMNVAMTRARMKLIIIGDVPTLTRHPFYRRLHDYVSSLSDK